jgi:hypothetical protein
MLTDFIYILVSERDNGGQFVNSCEEMLDFETNTYEVCMQDMLVNVAGWDNVRDRANEVYLQLWNHEKNRAKKKRTILIKPGRYLELLDFLKVLNEALKPHDIEFIHRPAKPLSRLGHELRKIEGGIISRPNLGLLAGPVGIYFTLTSKEKLNKAIVESETVEKLEQERLDSLELVTVKLPDKASLTFCAELAYLLGIVPKLTSLVPPIYNGKEIYGEDIDLTRNNLTLMWVCADFIHPTMFGPHQANILRLAPLQYETGALQHSIFALQHYVRVKSRKIQEFGVCIKEHLDGEPLKLVDKVVITLHFRTVE